MCGAVNVNLLVLKRGGMRERSKRAVLKTAEPERVPGVRIPLPPPEILMLAPKKTFSIGP